MNIAECIAQRTPFLQRFCLLRFVCGETTYWAAILARRFEPLGPLDATEADAIARGWTT